MKKSREHLGVIVISAALVLLSGVLAFGIAESFSQANLLNADTTIQGIKVPISYEKHLAEGNSLFEKGYFELALDSYHAAAEVQTEHPEAHEKMGLTYNKLNDFASAVVAFQKAYEISGSNLHGHYYVTALLHNKQLEKAQEVLTQLDPEAQETLYTQALIQVTQGLYESAEEQFRAAAEKGGHIDPAELQVFLDVYEDFAAQKGGQVSYLAATLTKALIDVQHYALAEQVALHVLEDVSDYRDLWSLLGYAKLKMEEYEGAEDAFKQAKDLDPLKPETHYFLGTSHYFQKEYAEAVESFELALLYGFEPEVEVYRKLAESQLFVEDYEEALATYEYLIKVDPYDLELFVRPLWIAVDITQDLNRALSLAEEAVEQFPQEAGSHNLLAAVYVEMGRIEEADDSVNKALELDPNSAEAHYNAGQVREAQGNIEGAKWEYKKAHELAEAGDNISEKASERYNELLNPKSGE